MATDIKDAARKYLWYHRGSGRDSVELAEFISWFCRCNGQEISVAEVLSYIEDWSSIK